jgi:carbonic anhydrase
VACDHQTPRTRSRRSALRTIALGGGAALLTTLPLVARASGHADALLLTCMDYRLMDEVAAYMQGRGMKDDYDHVVLAGASLGALLDKHPDWGRTFFEHLDVSLQLHHIKRVIVIDHRDCGAYSTFLGPATVSTPAKELSIHTRYLERLRAEIKKRHPMLEVELGLMGLDGKVQTIT